jgi:hypothetical protein
MKLFLAAVLASIASALTIVPTATAAQEKEWTDAAVAGLGDVDKKVYTDRVLVKEGAGLALAANEQAVKDKVTTASASSKSAWITANTKTTTAAETAQIEAKSAAQLSGQTKTDYEAYVARVAAGTQAQASQAELNAKATYDSQVQIQLAAWGAGTFEPLPASDAAFAMAATGALIAAAALF